MVMNSLISIYLSGMKFCICYTRNKILNNLVFLDNVKSNKTLDI